MRKFESPWRDGRTVVLTSGGLDSTTLLHALKSNGHAVEALFVAFGQPAVDREWQAVQGLCQAIDVTLARVDVVGLEPSFTRGIPGRNGLLVHTALLHRAPYRGLIAIGLHADPAYSDAGRPFIQATQRLLDLYNGGIIQIAAPFIDWPKADIRRYALDVGVAVDKTYSCDLGLDQPCGQCASCFDLAAVGAQS